MRKTLLSVVATLLVCLFFLTACQRHTGFRRLLSEADSLMRVDPDSAFRLLCRLDSAAESLPQSLRMQTLLLRCNAQNKADSLFENDSLGLLLTDYFDRKGTPNQRMLAHYILGCAYRDLDDRPAAIRCFNDAVAAADTAANDCDIYQLSIIYGQIGGIYNDLYLANEALDAYQMAENYACKLDDSIRILNIWSNKANAYITQGKIKLALKLKEKAADGFEARGKRRMAARIRELCIIWHVELGNLKKAKRYIDDYEAHSGNFLENGDIRPGLENYYDAKGTYYLKAQQLDSAEYFFRKLQRESQKLINVCAAAWGLSNLYEIYGQCDSVAKYAHIGDLADNERQIEITKERYQQNQAFFNYSRHEREALRYKVENLQTQRQLLLSFILVAFLLVVIVWVNILYRRRMKRQQDELNRDVDNKLSIINQLKEQIQSNKQEIEDLQLRLKNNEINQEQLEEQSKLIDELCQQISEYKQQQQKIVSINKRTKLFEMPPIRRLAELVDKQQGEPTNEEWNAVFAEVEKAYPSFCDLHVCPKMDFLDYEICVLTKLKFSIKDIIYLTHSSYKMVASRRRRLYKKLTNKEGSTTDFDELIHHYPESSPTDNHSSSDEMIIQ